MTTSTPAPLLEADRLSIGYLPAGGDSGFIRKEISFTAERGELVALIGPNGSGKSTLLKTLTGFIPPLKGSVRWMGKPVGSYTPAELARLISYVSTENLRLPNMRVADLVAYGRFPYTGWLGRLREEDLQMVSTSIRKTGLSDFARREVITLSDGERQRALIARALAQNTPFILLDEPTAFLDVSAKYEIFQLLRQLARTEGKTILLSTHDLNIALREADKFWMLTPAGCTQGAPEDAVLQGWLSHLFTHPQIGFDKTGGDFYLKTEPAGTAQVKGQGDALIWTSRALTRLGFSVVTEENLPLPPLSITITGEEDPNHLRWLLHSGETPITFSSLHALLSYLRQEMQKPG